MNHRISADEQQLIMDLLERINDLLGEAGRPADFDPDAWVRDLTDPVSPDLLYATRLLLGASLYGQAQPDGRLTRLSARLGSLQAELAR